MKAGQFIYIAGCDGTGKTTQVYLLLNQLQSFGVKSHHVWLRFPFFFSAPFLFFARWRGYSWFEQVGSHRFGYWDFQQSWIMRQVFPWVLFFDTTLAAIWKIYLPLIKGTTIICDRFVIDILVDLSVAIGSENYSNHFPGRLFLRLLPHKAGIVILDLDKTIILARRQELISDHNLETRLRSYRLFAARLKIPLISNGTSISDTVKFIWKELLIPVGTLDG